MTEPAASHEPVRPRDWTPGLLVAAPPLAVYLLTASQFVMDGDSATLATQAYRLGLAQPPGYALMAMVGKAVTTVVPLGPLAWRANLVAVLASAAGVLLAWQLLRRWGVEPIPAALAAWLLAFLPLFWSQALYVNPYAVSLACALALLLMLDAWSDRRNLGQLALAAAFYGFAMGGHPTFALYFPAVVLFVLWHLRADGSRRLLAACLVSVAAGLAGCLPWVLYTVHYLGGGEAGDGARSFTEFLTASGTGSDWRTFFAGVLDPGYPRALVIHVFRTLGELSPVGVLLACVGAVVLARRRPAAAALVGLSYAAQANMALTMSHGHFYDVYRLPCHALLVLLAGVGLGWVWNRLPAGKGRWHRRLACGGAIVASLALSHGLALWASRTEASPASGLQALLCPNRPIRTDFAREGHRDGLLALATAEAGSTLVANWGPHATLHYLQRVERPAATVRLIAGFDGGDRLRQLLSERKQGTKVYAYVRRTEVRLLAFLDQAFVLSETAPGSAHVLCEVVGRR